METTFLSPASRFYPAVPAPAPAPAPVDWKDKPIEAMSNAELMALSISDYRGRRIAAIVQLTLRAERIGQ
jgi:hypothetical protein